MPDNGRQPLQRAQVGSDADIHLLCKSRGAGGMKIGVGVEPVVVPTSTPCADKEF